ncbi:MAG: S1C family serine protease [Anaerovoracaceae bacterium]|jgi:serine protease Do
MADWNDNNRTEQLEPNDLASYAAQKEPSAVEVETRSPETMTVNETQTEPEPFTAGTGAEQPSWTGTSNTESHSWTEGPETGSSFQMKEPQTGSSFQTGNSFQTEGPQAGNSFQTGSTGSDEPHYETAGAGIWYTKEPASTGNAFDDHSAYNNSRFSGSSTENTGASNYYQSTESGSGYGTTGSFNGGGFNTGNGGFDSGSGAFNGGNGGFDGGGNNYTSAPGGRRSGKAAAQPLTITKKALVLIIIICMVVTAAASLGLTALYFNKTNAGQSATNYTLTKSSDKLTFDSIIKKAQDSVVSITTESMSTDEWAQNYVTQGAGSGVIIQSNGYIVTCNHVIEDATKITVTLNNKKKYTAKIVGTNSDKDIAVLKINATGLTAATYGDSSDLVVGSTVVAIGNPLGQLSNTATTGIISALNRNLTIDGKKMNLLQTDASINPGNSGGGLFDQSGNLIGIVVAKSTGSDVEGLGFAIPVNRVAKVAKNLIKNGGSSSSSSSSSTSGTAAIGVTVTEISDEEAQQYGVSEGGVYIYSVTSSYAEEAGLQSGDRITAIGSTKISTSSELSSALSKYSPGDRARITIERNGQETTVSVTLTSKSSTSN